MINEIEVLKLKEHVNLHLINSEKFKTIIIDINYYRPLNEREASYGSLLSKVLGRTSKNFPKAQLLSQRQDELYGLFSGMDIVKIGERIALQFKTSYVNSKAIPEDLHTEAFEMTKELLFNPNIINNGFDPAILETERAILIEEIESKINDKASYSVERAIEIICADEPYRHYNYGDSEIVKTITAEDLYAYYLDVINHSQVDFIIMGGTIDNESMIDRARKLLDMTIENPLMIDKEVFVTDEVEPRYVSEIMNVNQCRFVQAYRTPIEYGSQYYFALQILSTILGGTATSRLFNIVREQESLCYAINSRVEKLKGILMVVGGIDPVNAQKVEVMVDQIIQDIVDNGPTLEELDTAKRMSKASLEGLSDYQYAFIGYYMTQSMLGSFHTIDSLIDKIDEVTIQDVQEAAALLRKNLIYVIKGADLS